MTTMLDLPKHGVSTSYKKGCRCDDCTAENRERVAAYRSNRPPKVCVICGGTFTKYSRESVRTCSPECTNEVCRRAARERWGERPVDPPKTPRRSSRREYEECFAVYLVHVEAMTPGEFMRERGYDPITRTYAGAA